MDNLEKNKNKRRYSQEFLCFLILCFLINPLKALEPSPYAEGLLLEIITQMPEGTWKKVNINSFSEVWTPSELRPLNLLSNPPPSKLISAWSSFAWDSNRGDLILYGGGHANYSGNDVYRWRSRDLRWERASLPSQITVIAGTSASTAIDGVDAAPASAHTYDNSVFLPILDRYLVLGGALYNTGGPYIRQSETDPTVTRLTGPYLFDPEKASASQVGGTTGSHVQRVYAFPEITGGEMWQNRDVHKHLATSILPKHHVNGCTAYANESGVDTVYISASGSIHGTGQSLFRYQITDANSPWTDKIDRVAIYWGAPSDQPSCGYDPVAKINPMIGFRGASRYISLQFQACFELECQALRKVRDEMGLTNVEIMIPFCRTLEEAQRVTALLATQGLSRGENGLRVIMMCEIPSNALLADEFLQFFDGFSIGSNDMTQLCLGLDRDSSLVAHAFDERNPAVKKILKMAIDACRAQGKYIGICGQGPSDYPDFAAWLNEVGISSLSLNPDSIVETWLYLASLTK